ncbi:hypothetical protein [Microbacterium immunditiarum]|uniref:hypothetical protein n=1 Tax=Microbacterium immunditiarum TaxID=337480 RepID=UPI001C5373D8|nr:hypothetical protein [Microbacterium immunditiarum]
MRTLDGKPVTWRHATVPIGAALQIVPAFVATATEQDIEVDATVEAHYRPEAGRYLVSAVTARAVNPDGNVTSNVLRTVRVGEVLTAAVPRCITVEHEFFAHRATVDQLTTAEGRLIPEDFAAQARKAGPKPDTLELVQLIYSVAALAGVMPIKAVQDELGITNRTAVYWTTRARAAGLLDGITFPVGRKADG